MEKYTFIKEIGSGSFGKVFLVKSKQQGINYVVKKVDLKKLDLKQRLSATKEVELLAKLRHNNVVSYKESYEINNELNIVLEYCENGDLHNKIKEKRTSNKFFSENEIFDYFVQISLALEYIHSHKILHRDLKTKNIFLTKGDVVKLGDFGIAKTLENSFELAQTCIGSPFYLSPEICESKPYNKKSDVWALGCVLYELATLRYAFVAKNVKTLISKILTGAYNPLPTNMNIHIRTLISCMLKPDPMERPSVREILGKQFLIKRRAAFVCKTYRNDFYKRRSRSGCRNPLQGIVKNDIEINNKGRLSASCLQLNQRKYNNISNPKAKYDPPNNCGKNLVMKNEAEKLFKKLPKVDSEYYNLIAGRDGKEVEKNEFPVKKITDDESVLTNLKPDIKKIQNIVQKTSLDADEDILKEKKEVRDKIVQTNEGRKRWMKNTLQKEAVLAMFNESELLDVFTFGNKSGRRRLMLGERSIWKDILYLLCHFPRSRASEEFKQSVLMIILAEKSIQKNQTIDELLTINPSEIRGNVLQPIQIYETEPRKNQCKIFQLLKHEIKYIKEKFELNDRNYDIEDLIGLTHNSKKILKLSLQNFTEHDRKVGESAYHDLECLRIKLENKIGFCIFSKVYPKMNNIINDEMDSKLEKQIDPMKTYVIKKIHVADDGDDPVTRIWKSIVNILADKKEYLPDVWELAMSEYIYYHF